MDAQIQRNIERARQVKEQQRVRRVDRALRQGNVHADAHTVAKLALIMQGGQSK